MSSMLSCKQRVVKNIQVPGPGCANCKNTVALIEQLAKTISVAVQVEKMDRNHAGMP